METKPPYINHWKRLQKSYSSEKAHACKNEIQRLLGISQSAFYRKLNDPEQLSVAEKFAIAKVYGLQMYYLFPEAEAVMNSL